MIKTADKFVNDIIVKDNGGNLTNINKIYNRGTIYWGNYTPPAPPFTGIRGTANVTSQTINGAIYYNGTTHNIEVDADGNFELAFNEPITDSYKLCRTNVITSLDLRNVNWGLLGTGSINAMFDSGGSYNGLTDVYFDFTGENTEDMICATSIFRGLGSNCKIHGFGTFKWTGPLVKTGNDWTHCICLREFNVSGLGGTLDIRGIDTTAITDQPNSVWDNNYGLQNVYGYWYNFCGSITCNTWIVGALEVHYLNTMSGARNCRTLYCTSPTPPSLDRTGANGVTAKNWLSSFTGLQNIYVPVGHLSDYTNASVWSNYASLMSELDAPDPLTI